MYLPDLRISIPTLVLIGAVSLSAANSFGPQLSRTGAPALGTIGAEKTCNDAGCHSGNPMNLNGIVEILGAPQTYTPGQSYTVTVRLSSTATQSRINRRWGFELTAVRLSDGRGAGSFSSQDLLIRDGDVSTGNRSYISHGSGTLMPGAPSPVEWSFTWNAPAQDQGAVGFYVAANAADGNLTNTGDFIYTASSSAKSPSTPARTITWGRLKTAALMR